MNFNNSQFYTLAYYEPYLRTATIESWSRNPGRAALEDLAGIWRDYSRQPAFRMNYNCSTCILNLLRDLGRPYFADKAERIAAAKAKAQETEIRISPDTGDYHPAEEKPEEAAKKAAETAQEKKVGATATKAPKVAGKVVKMKK